MTSIKDIIIVFGDCDLKHEKLDNQDNRGELDLEKRIISIAPHQDPINTYATVIHEALHYHYERRGIHKTEAEILKEEKALMYRWFKVKDY